ncbi:hypothetical protein C2857_003381 [Epichloe festucae Fl1]|uniref:Rhodopsin domain-containing protein n=1 Tax=Epichloe festucae (strain Fl1) TaxID=877507 RepID=A0A7S9KUU3_EPIFF|nr:hypothetical protein C2857_003381 [Epichloe festucae Fl1]
MSMIYFSTKLGTIANMTDEIALTLTDEQKNPIIAGSKFLFAEWCVYISLIWSLKACMLFLYGRLTLDLKQRDMVKICAILCGITYVAAILTTFTHCIPLRRKWQVYPYPGEACAVYVPNFYVLTVTNVSTELLIACIPIPLLWKVRMSWPKKFLCCLWLCTGVCVIVATLLRCILSLRDIHTVNLTTIWSARETFIGIIAVNVPILGPFIARTVSRLSGLKSRNSSKPGGERDGSVPGPPEAGGHRLSIMERRAKQERIRRGMRWTTFDEASDEDIAKDEYEMHSIFSTRTTNDTHSSLRVGCGSTYV